MKRYEDQSFFYARKPQGIPSTLGSQFSFLEQIENENSAEFQQLQHARKREEERGLLNRLDNDTAGLLYFAKSPVIAEMYHSAQEKGNTLKQYLCDVQGDMRRFVHTNAYVQWTHHPILPNEPALCVTYPIMHHIQDDQKMVVVRQRSDSTKGRGKEHHVKTFFVPLYYDEASNTTTAYALISQGIRHQIRVHAAALGYPLIGDRLYKGVDASDLHLWSVGLTVFQ